MDILTKISVVVLVVLVLLAVPVFINGVLVPQNYKQAYTDEQAKVTAAEQKARENSVAYETALQQLQQARQQASTLSSQGQQELENARRQLQTEQLRSADLASKLDSINAQVVDLNANYQRYIERANQFSATIADQQKQLDDLRQSNVKQEEDLRQARGDYERVEQINRGLREQLAELHETVEGKTGVAAPAAGNVAQPAAAGTAATAAPAGLSGTVTAVKGDLASINIGTANGVAPGMELVIARGGLLVGYLRIEQADVSTADGIISDRQMDVQQGDRVTTRAELFQQP